MLSYDELDDVLRGEMKTEQVDQQLASQYWCPSQYRNDEVEDDLAISLERTVLDDAEEYSFWRRGKERTYYHEEHPVAVKVFDYSGSRRDLLREAVRSSALETPLREATMLEAARDEGYNVAEPFRITREKKTAYLFKRAGSPDGEVPYWLTDLEDAAPHYTEADIESHLAECYERTLDQFFGLADAGMLHKSITPLSHRADDPFNVYTRQKNIRGLEPEVNITPTGRLNDFEHVIPTDNTAAMKRSIGWDERATPFAEILMTYADVGLGCSLQETDVTSILSDGLEELEEKRSDIEVPSSLNVLVEEINSNRYILKSPERNNGFSSTLVHNVTKESLGHASLPLGSFTRYLANYLPKTDLY